jgi:WD40 repeat protein/anti-sigma factor RsiW
MTPQTPCPDQATLASLLDGRLAEAEEAPLSRHLEQCARCRAALDALAVADGVREMRPGPITPPDEVLRRAMDALKADPRRLSTPHPVDDGLVGLLAPTDEPGLLGRLGPYEITGLVGRGGAGIVLKGFDPSLNRFVAIKVLAPHLASSVAARQRFAREARATAAVSHEHVVAIHGVDEANGLPYLVMEYVAGISLQERLDRTGPLELEEVLRIGAQVASGLAAAHAQGLVHRDVKPGNILLESGIERVKITDFGLARAADDASLTQSGAVSGTPAYMAPEQARGDPLDYRADLFSLGSVLYAMCTARAPFRASTTLAVLRRVMEEEPPALREVNPAAPEWLAAIIARLHAKDPAQRFPSADEVARLLERCLLHVRQPTRFPPPAIGRLPGQRRSRRRLRTMAVVLALAAGLAVAGVAFRGMLPWPWGGAANPRLAREPRSAALSAIEIRPDPEGLGGPTAAAAISPDGKWLAAAETDGAVRLWDLEKHRPQAEALRERVEHPRGVAYSADGSILAVCGGDMERAQQSGGIVLWDTRTKTELRRLGSNQCLVFGVAFSPKEPNLLAAACMDRTVRLWDATTGEERIALSGHDRPVRSVCFSRDGDILASGGYDGTVRLWDMKTFKESRRIDTRRTENQRYWVSCVVFSPDGRTLAIAENPGEGLAAPVPEGGPRPGQISLWDPNTGSERATLPVPRGLVLALAFSRDGKALVSGGGSPGEFGEVCLWDVARRARLPFEGRNAGCVESVVFSRNGKTLVAAGGHASRGEARLWDIPDADTSAKP